MKKLFIEKNEPVPSVVERIIEEGDMEIVLVIPKDSHVGSSAANFRLLKRESQAAGKHLLVESVDDGVLALATSAEIDAAHPLFKPEGTPSISDIVPAKAKPATPPTTRGKVLKPTVRAEAKKEPTEDMEKVEQEIRETPTVIKRSPSVFEMSPKPVSRVIGGVSRMGGMFKGRTMLMRTIIGAVVLFVLLGGAGFASARLLGKAEVTLTFKKTPWEYRGNFIASKSLASGDIDKGTLPAEVFKETRNLVQTFPATGKANVSQKAKTRILIWNAYNTEPQALVATTRFITPDGKMFRLDDRVTVPGATMKDGKLVPASVEANVTADKPGPAYNVGPIEHLTIPGFQGTPRYEKFYGAMLQAATGGFIGERATPTAKDIDDAKTKMDGVLTEALKAAFLATQPSDFVIPQGAMIVKVNKLSVNTNTDESGNFSIFGEASMQAVGFKEGTLKELLLAAARKDVPNSTFKDISFDYAQVKPNFAAGQATFTLAATATLTPVFSPSDFTQSIAGKSVREANPIVKQLPDLVSAKISLKPRWAWSIPSNPAKVTVTVD